MHPKTFPGEEDTAQLDFFRNCFDTSYFNFLLFLLFHHFYLKISKFCMLSVVSKLWLLKLHKVIRLSCWVIASSNERDPEAVELLRETRVYLLGIENNVNSTVP